MNIDTLLLQYGVAAIFLLMLIKSVGVPIPIPADVIILTVAAGAAQGKFVLWQAFTALLLAFVAGGLIQFILARGPGRNILYRFGRFIGLTSSRLDAASARVKKGGILGIGLTILIPGIRGVAIVAAGLADIPLMTFSWGLVLGSTLFLGLHFILGYLGGTFLGVIAHVLPTGPLATILLLLLAAAFGLWVFAYRRQKAERTDRDDRSAASFEVLHEGICPICLALYTTNQLRTLSVESKI